MLGVIDMPCPPTREGLIHVEGRDRASWLPWHFDHCYNNELNRAGVLRAVDIPPADGMTGFVDGIALYNALSPDLRARIEGHNVLYRMNVIMGNFHFGAPAELPGSLRARRLSGGDGCGGEHPALGPPGCVDAGVRRKGAAHLAVDGRGDRGR